LTTAIPVVFDRWPDQPAGRLMMSSKADDPCRGRPGEAGPRRDDLRVELRHALVAEAEPFDRGHAHVMDQHVGGGNQALEHGTAARRFQVDRQRALVAVHRQEYRAHARGPRDTIGTHQVALEGFDLDDLAP
jgi:hypothetical protein